MQLVDFPYFWIPPGENIAIFLGSTSLMPTMWCPRVRDVNVGEHKPYEY
jgi:hypothetical protein